MTMIIEFPTPLIMDAKENLEPAMHLISGLQPVDRYRPRRIGGRSSGCANHHM